MNTIDIQTIGDYGYLSDCQTGALVGKNGSIDWYCPFLFDAASVFGRILDPRGGHWSIAPVIPFVTSRSYIDGTMVLRTEFISETGTVAMTDALLFDHGDRGHEIGNKVPHALGRIIEGISGSVEMQLTFSPQMEYGLTQPLFQRTADGVSASAGNTVLELRSNLKDLQIGSREVTAQFTVTSNEHTEFLLTARHSIDAQPEEATFPGISARLTDTRDGWQSWSELHPYDGRYAAQVRRSALVLQALTYQPAGAIVAAPTTSLPETEGGNDTWDYRYVWLRDLSMTMRALWVAACPDESAKFLRWLVQVDGGNLDEREFQPIMYSVLGQRDLTEHTLDHLAGYQGCRPVRVGNDAWDQHQLDVLGEVVDAVYLLRNQIGELDDDQKRLIIALANKAATTWHLPDAGMWEARDRERHYLSSKVMCWVALDRALQMAPNLGTDLNLDDWYTARGEIHAEILDRGWSEKIQAYAGAFDSDELDASVLLMPIVGFLPATDARMKRTIETIARDLAADGVVHRWKDDRNGFLICTFWLVECLALAGDQQRASALFEHALTFTNDLGLMAEEVDAATGIAWGNFPQAFSHVGLINAAWRLGECERPKV